MFTNPRLASHFADLHRAGLLADASQQHHVRRVRAQASTPRPAGPRRLNLRSLVLVAAVSAILGASIAGTADAARMHPATSTVAPVELVAYVTATPGIHGKPVPDFRWH